MVKTINQRGIFMKKICSICHDEKPIEEFVKNKNKPSGYSQPCLICNRKKQNALSPLRKEQRREWVQNNKEKTRGYNRKARLKNPEKELERHRLYNARQAGYNSHEEYQEALRIKAENKKAEKLELKRIEKQAKDQARAQARIDSKKRAIEAVNYSVDNSGCWNIESGAHLHKNGYWYIGKQGAHREFYRYYKGEIKPGAVIRHTCDNPRCVNPTHLVQGSNKDNTQDMIERDRVCRDGLNPKLLEAEIIEIFKSNESSYALADKYNVTDTHIRRIKRGDRCADIASKISI